MAMYDEVVVDVKRLREEAKRYGENLVLEQLAPKINEAINSILEQDPFQDEEDPAMPPSDTMGGLEDDLGAELGDTMGMGGGEAGLESDLAKDLPLAATESENTCSCPDEDEEIEIDFDNLMRIGEPAPEEVPMEEPDNLYESEEREEESEEEESSSEDEEEESEDELNEAFDLDEIDLGQFEEGLQELAEELEVDFEAPEKTGQRDVPGPELDHIEDLHIASMMDDERKEDFKKKQKALNALKESYKELMQEKILLEKKASNYKKKIKDFEDIVLRQQNKLSSLTAMNSRLLYVNKVLTNESLNGLQKEKIVEALGKAKTPEEAKLIFETLQSTVGSQVRKKQPKSRSEVAHYSPQTNVVKTSVEQQTTIDRIDESVKQRLQKLANIIK